MHSKFFQKLTSASLLVLLTHFSSVEVRGGSDLPVPGQLKVKYYGAFSELPLGSIRARGWLEKWLQRQAQGLTGHPENLCYPYDTCMFAGEIPPPAAKSKWWKEWWPYEQSAYFVDATTRLSWVFDAEDISRRRDANLDYILEHSSETNLGGSRACWPNAVVGRALMAQFSATGDTRVARVMQDWLLGSAVEIVKGGRNGANFEEAFYLYGLTGDTRLLELCRAIYTNSLSASNSFCTREKIQAKALFHEHGVTAAELLKCLPLMYSYTGDRDALRLAQQAYAKILEHNLMPDGGICSSEHLERTSFYSVHESCDITDWSWSLGYMFMATGDARFADLIERTTFNALPGAVTKNFKQFQYFSSVNQLVIGPTNSHTPHWPTRMSYRAAHDTECCAGNINRAMPNYISRAWMRPTKGGLAAVYYGPSEVATTINGQTVVISEETDYPFRDTILFRIKTDRPVAFELHFRIPEWCSEPVFKMKSETVQYERLSEGFVVIQREFHDGDSLRLKLPMSLRLEDCLEGKAVCVTRGPLVYSLNPTEKRIEHTSDPDDLKPFLEGHEIRAFPEVEFSPQSDWRYGLNAALKQNLQNIKIIETTVTDNPFLAEEAPVRLDMPLVHLPDWRAVSNAAFGTEPLGLPTAKELATRQPSNQTLVPYGTTHLRLTTFPLLFAR